MLLSFSCPWMNHCVWSFQTSCHRIDSGNASRDPVFFWLSGKRRKWATLSGNSASVRSGSLSPVCDLSRNRDGSRLGRESVCDDAHVNSKMLSPNHRVAVVTGGAQGIGRRTAELFAERGYRVAMIDLRLPAETVK